MTADHHHTSEAEAWLCEAEHYATDRAETEPCERGTVGCSVKHTADTPCEAW